VIVIRRKKRHNRREDATKRNTAEPAPNTSLGEKKGRQFARELGPRKKGGIKSQDGKFGGEKSILCREA